jgi:hypothetical protein
MADKIISPNGLYELNIQDDGNSVTYRRADGKVIWASGGDQNPLPPSPPLPPNPGRKGIVRLSGRCLQDDGGAWLALGASYFPLLWMMRHDTARADQNLAWLAYRGVEAVRIFADVSGPTWADRSVQFTDPDWLNLAREAVMLAQSKGMRIIWTLFAGPREQHDPAWYRMATQSFAGMIAERPEAILYAEIRNEGEGPNDAIMRECAATLRGILPQLPVALCGTPEKLLPGMYAGSQANLTTVHWDRRYEERGWRPVRQPWGYYELHDMPVAHANNEPIGIDSSVASESDPNHLAGAALTAWVTGECCYVLHTGAGVRAGGAADLARNPPRKANVWEQPTFEETLIRIAALRAVLPMDLPNWERHGHAWPSHPLDIQSDVGDDCEAPGGTGCNRCYAATHGDRAVVGVTGIRKQFLATSKGAPFTVIRPWQLAVGPQRNFDLAEEDGSIALLIR